MVYPPATSFPPKNLLIFTARFVRNRSCSSRDKDAPEGDKVGAEKKGGEGGNATDAVLATPAESRTALLSKRVAAEGKTANKRAKRMANLSSQLKK